MMMMYGVSFFFGWQIMLFHFFVVVWLADYAVSLILFFRLTVCNMSVVIIILNLISIL